MEHQAEQKVMASLPDDRVWAYLELRSDLTYPYMTPEKRQAYINSALTLGRSLARRYRGLSVHEVTTRLGVPVRYIDRESKIRASYANRTIFVNRWALNRITLHLQGVPLQPGQANEAAIAHELFHHLEAIRAIGIDTAFPLISTFPLGHFWVRKRRVQACREIAAHSFAKEVAQLPCLPNAFDWLIAVAEKRKTWHAVAALLPGFPENGENA